MTEPEPPPDETTAPRASGPVLVAATIVGLEAAVLFVYAVLEATHVDPGQPTIGITTAIFFCLFALGIGAAAYGLVRLRSWSRSPIVLAQVIQVGIAWGFRGHNTTWVALLLAVPAVLVLVILFSPGTTVALYGKRGRYGDSGPRDD
ncbi:MAG: hypothetical protein ACRDPG_12235 [Nocardioidaceae bacterium]